MERRKGKVVAYFASAVQAADKIFCPRYLFTGERDETLDRLYQARALIGLLVIVGVAILYHHTASAALAPLNDWIERTLGSLAVIAALLAVGLVVALIWTVRDSRRAMLSNLLWPSVLVAAFFAGFLDVIYLRAGDHGKVVSAAVASAIGDFVGFSFWRETVVVAVTAIGVPWFMVFVFRSVYQLASGMSRAVDAHPLLGPLVGTAAAWILCIEGLANGAGANGVPQTVALVVILGGPISITALSVLEALRLRRRYPGDWPFRKGPLPLRPDADIVRGTRPAVVVSALIAAIAVGIPVVGTVYRPRPSPSAIQLTGTELATLLPSAGRFPSGYTLLPGRSNSDQTISKDPIFGTTCDQLFELDAPTNPLELSGYAFDIITRPDDVHYFYQAIYQYEDDAIASSEFSQWRTGFAKCHATERAASQDVPITAGHRPALYITIAARRGSPPGVSLITLDRTDVLVETWFGSPDPPASPALSSLIIHTITNIAKAAARQCPRLKRRSRCMSG
jgi:hypothetical protein